MSSATPVACALAELGVPHEARRLDLKAGEQKRPEFMKLNPHGQVPTLVVDDTPMFEGLAIILWLGERYGVERQLWPASNSSLRLTAMAWTTWAYVTYIAAVHNYAFATSSQVASELHHPAQAKHYLSELGRLRGILEARLTKQKYLLGDSYSLVDLTVASAMVYGSLYGVSLDEFPALARWFETCQARPAVRKVLG